MSAMTLEPVYEQLTPFAERDCHFCDGRGVFYGNVCICDCVMAKLTTHAQMVEKVREVIGEMEDYGEWSFAQMLRKAIGGAIDDPASKT